MTGPENANVHSLDGIRDLQLGLIAFGERISTALAELRTKIDRTLAWLEQDRPNYSREQERRAYDLVASARVAYETCRMRTVGGRHSECIEEKVAFQRAKTRLEFCKHKMEVVRRWNVEAGSQADDYRGRAGPLQRSLDEDVPNMVAMLSRMLDALEHYADVRPGGGLSSDRQETPEALDSLEDNSKDGPVAESEAAARDSHDDQLSTPS